MNLHFQAFSVQKAGYQADQYEDAWAFDEACRRVAIADGASDGFESRVWSRTLAQALLQHPPEPDAASILSWLDAPIQDWESAIDWDTLPWYGMEKARRGAFATLLGVAFEVSVWENDPSLISLCWSAMALGDACLFQVREEALIECFPVVQAEDFGTAPPLLSTRPEYSSRSLEDLQVRKGRLGLNDVLLLATDALAAWFLGQAEEGNRPWEALAGLDAEAFAEFVDAQRRENAMRNDDVTLVVVQVADG